MPKEVGFAMTVALDDAAVAAKSIENDITSLNFSTPRGVQDITGVDASGVERLLLLSDFQATLNGVFNTTADKSHDVLKTVSSTSVTRTLTIVINSKTLAVETIVSDYALSRAQTGELTWTAPIALNATAVPAWA